MRYRNLILIVVLIVLIALFLIVRRGKPDEKVLRVFDADSTRIGGFELYNAADTIAVHKVAGQWMLSKPVKWPANPDRMRYFFSEVLPATYSGNPMSEDPKSHSNYNLEPDKALHLKVMDTGGKVIAHCLFGNSGNPFDYFRFDGDPNVYRVQQKILGYFEPDISGWRSPSVIAIPPELLAKVSVVHPKNTYTLIREGNIWNYSDKLENFSIPEQNQSMGKILNIVSRLDSYTVEDGTQKDLSKYSKEAEVVLTKTDGSTEKLNFVKDTENYYLIRNDDISNLFLVPFDVLHRFTRHAATFRAMEWGGELPAD